jgi:precorrin-6Y C5,15-methyltransferase (decarboxylating)
MGGELTRLSVQRARPLGAMVAWQPALPVTQWAWVKP